MLPVLTPPSADKPEQRLFVAIDTPDLDQASALAETLAPVIGGLKLGKEFFTAHGPEGIRHLSGYGVPMFLDLKFHDIPHTVAGAVRSACALGPAMLTLHASGGAAMMQAARDAALAACQDPQLAAPCRPLLLAVTVLTSLGEEDLMTIGQHGPIPEQVRRLGQLAEVNGLDGAVCSAREAPMLRRVCGPTFRLVVPGIRPDWAVKSDQKRTLTPTQAMEAGADWLVVGRPITAATDSRAAARRVIDEIGEGLLHRELETFSSEVEALVGSDTEPQT